MLLFAFIFIINSCFCYLKMYFGKVSRKQFFVKKFVQIFDSYHHVVLHGAAFSSTAWESYTDEYIIRTDFKVY